MAAMNDRLYRSRTDKFLGGVSGGIGRHHRLDPLIIRLLWVAALFTPLNTVAFLVYILCWVLIPREPSGWRPTSDYDPGPQRGVFLGIALVIIGVVSLLAATIAVSWPVLLALGMIILGALIVLGVFPNGHRHHNEG